MRIKDNSADSGGDAGEILTLTRQQLEEIVEERTWELKAANRLLVQSLNSASEMLFALDREWRITFWNNTAERFAGRMRHEVMGRNIWEVIPESVGSFFYQQFQYAMRENKLVSMEAYSKVLGKWVESRTHPTDYGISVFIKDISKHKQIEKDLKLINEQFNRAFDTTPLSMAIVSVESGKILKANDMYGTYTNYGAEARKTGFDVNILLDKPSDRGEIINRIRREQKVRNIPINVRTKDGEVKTLLMSAMIINRPQGHRFYGDFPGKLTHILYRAGNTFTE